MQEFNLERLNKKRIELGEKPIDVTVTIDKVTKTLDNLTYKDIEMVGTKGDIYTKQILDKILQKGTYDHQPRPYYEDIYLKDDVIKFHENTGIILLNNGKEIELCEKDKIITTEKEIIVHSPAHTLSINNEFQCRYDFSKDESPMITLRPIATRTSIAEIIWIFFRKSNDLVEFDQLLGHDDWNPEKPKIHNWWIQWAVVDKAGNHVLNSKGHPMIGKCYGGTVEPRDMFNEEVMKALRETPDSRRIICSLWQVDDFKQPHGLKPCAFQTIWNVRHEWDGHDYLDMCLVQRSSDFCTAGCINQTQYGSLLKMVARDISQDYELRPGVFTWSPVNVQIYDRHIGAAIEMLNRDPVICDATIKLDPKVKKLSDVTPDSITILDEKTKKLIKQKNPQLTLQLGI